MRSHYYFCIHVLIGLSERCAHIHFFHVVGSIFLTGRSLIAITMNEMSNCINETSGGGRRIWMCSKLLIICWTVEEYCYCLTNIALQRQMSNISILINSYFLIHFSLHVHNVFCLLLKCRLNAIKNDLVFSFFFFYGFHLQNKRQQYLI